MPTRPDTTTTTTTTDDAAPKRLTPTPALGDYALWLNRGDRKAVRLGTPADVPAHLRPYRFGKRPTAEDRAEYERAFGEPLPGPLATIRATCVGCAENAAEVRRCPCASCPLHPYRMGTNPARSGIGGGIGGFARLNPASVE